MRASDSDAGTATAKRSAGEQPILLVGRVCGA
jgi:hypothetical protein